MRITMLGLAIALAATACGDNLGAPDAPRLIDSPRRDAAIDAFAGCNYNEMDDADNDYLAVMGAIEETHIGYLGTQLTFCGNVNNGHYDMAESSVDIDNYGITIERESDVLVSLVAPGAIGNSGLQLGVFAVDDSGNGFGIGNFLGDHGVFSSHMPPGHYQFSVEAYADADLSAGFPYRFTIAPDMPDSRCGPATGAATYMEAHDGATSTGNDVIAIDYSVMSPTSPYSLTALPTDVAEPTGLTIADTGDVLITGTSAAVVQHASYFDRDSYAITTGPTTNQIAIRLNWPSTTADLDYFLFENTFPIGDSSKQQLGEDEFATFSVEPNTSYLFWVGQATSDSAGSQADYSATICGEHFTPPSL